MSTAMPPPLGASPTVSIIVDTYYRPAMLREAIESLLAQTWPHVEIVIVDNGSTADTKPVIAELVARSPAIKLVTFAENQFDFFDLKKQVPVVYNAGLHASTGELVFHMNDDDWVSLDFCERMARLFIDNPACTTAIGLPVPVRPDGSKLDTRPGNQRPRYMPGHELGLAVLDGKPVFGNPGHGFVMRRDALEQAGNFREFYEDHLLYGVAAFGVTGFDFEACMYWRYHDNQLNKLMKARGVVYSSAVRNFLRESRLEQRWKDSFGQAAARRVTQSMLQRMDCATAEILADNLAALRPAPAWRCLKGGAPYPDFWKALPSQMWEQRRLFAANVARALGLKPLLDRLRNVRTGTPT
jgi:glycosyltransferase involved in cell wall biosynthesis